MVRECTGHVGIVPLSLCWEKVAVVSGSHSNFTPGLLTLSPFFFFFLLGELRGGRTETSLALKYLLRKGFPGGRNASVPQVLIIITDGRSQGHVALPAKQLKLRGVTVFTVGIRFPR